MSFVLLLGCAPVATDSAEVADTGDTAAADTGADTADTAWDTAVELNGNWAAERIPAPEFAATNRDDTARSRPDLVGHPTVMWFYPAAGTAG